MCTAVSFQTKDHYFGRNLDLEFSYHETVTITPRKFPLEFRKVPALKNHYAMIGVAYVVDDYPLYYDAVNEKGLAIAGLNFPGNAHYRTELAGMDNISPFELIPWLLGQCADLEQVRQKLSRLNLAAIDFSGELPLSPLHWMVSDKSGSLVVEAMKDGIHICGNPAGVLTNNPPFDFQMYHLANYMGLTGDVPENRFSKAIPLSPCSRGMGAMGLPGDLSSMSRFVRAAFVRANSLCGESEEESVSQFFHILAAVEQQRGCVRLEDGKNEITVYSSCCNADRGIYYYRTYENSQISGVDMHRENLDGEQLVSYPLIREQQFRMQN